jgi:hypothetical protein
MGLAKKSRNSNYLNSFALHGEQSRVPANLFDRVRIEIANTVRLRHAVFAADRAALK